ncbi:MAG TPA: cytidylate kinase-like family protein [Candidatus Limnocylindrales bacterium]|nr:cytidylate kinase-like family protein [Candidatus Limnocylindrales bacterium]
MPPVMGFRVVCISYTDGAGAEPVGHRVADQLGYRYVNEEIILEASRMARVDPALVTAAEKKQSFFDRLLDSLASAQQTLGPAALAAGFAVPIVPEVTTTRPADKEDLRTLIRAVIHEVGKQGNAVIAAHAASLALAGRSGVMRVLLTAPDDVRARRIATERGLSQEDAAEAIARGDSGRREYLRTFYEVDDESPTRYDVVLNTEVLTAEQAASIIVTVAR